jgi:hypothetical protein
VVHGQELTLDGRDENGVVRLSGLVGEDGEISGAIEFARNQRRDAAAQEAGLGPAGAGSHPLQRRGFRRRRFTRGQGWMGAPQMPQGWGAGGGQNPYPPPATWWPAMQPRGGGWMHPAQQRMMRQPGMMPPHPGFQQWPPVPGSQGFEDDPLAMPPGAREARRQGPPSQAFGETETTETFVARRDRTLS